MDPRTAYILRTRQQQLALRLHNFGLELHKLKEVRREFGVARVEDAGGRKMPFHGVLSLPMAFGSLRQVERVLPVTQIGPFVITALAAYWLGSDGRFRPVSSIVDNEQNPPVVDGLDFVFQIRTAGSGLNWQREPVPSSGLFSSYDRPRYLAAPEWLKPSDSVIFTATPIRRPDSTGLLKVVFCGHKNIDTSRWAR